MHIDRVLIRSLEPDRAFRIFRTVNYRHEDICPCDTGVFGESQLEQVAITLYLVQVVAAPKDCLTRKGHRTPIVIDLGVSRAANLLEGLRTSPGTLDGDTLSICG